MAVAEVDGPEAALALVDALDLDGYHLFHAVRADLLRRLGRGDEAGRAYEAAIASSPNAAERDFLRSRRDGAEGACPSGAGSCAARSPRARRGRRPPRT